MPRYYCDYCDTYLTHDSPSVRKQHNSGYKHKANVRSYYQKFEEEQTQIMIDQKIKERLGQAVAYQQIGAAYNQHLAAFPGQRPRLPMMPPPMLPVPGALPPQFVPGVRPSILPIPAPGAPGYSTVPPTAPITGQMPPVSSLPVQSAVPPTAPIPGQMPPVSSLPVHSAVPPTAPIPGQMPPVSSLPGQPNALPAPPALNPLAGVPGGAAPPSSIAAPVPATQSMYQPNPNGIVAAPSANMTTTS